MTRVPVVDDMTLLGAYIWAIWDYWGKDTSRCELCGKLVAKPTVHHTKYDGATIYDLVVACMRCQVKRENRGLV